MNKKTKLTFILTLVILITLVTTPLILALMSHKLEVNNGINFVSSEPDIIFVSEYERLNGKGMKAGVLSENDLNDVFFYKDDLMTLTSDNSKKHIGFTVKIIFTIGPNNNSPLDEIVYTFENLNLSGETGIYINDLNQFPLDSNILTNQVSGSETIKHSELSDEGAAKVINLVILKEVGGDGFNININFTIKASREGS